MRRVWIVYTQEVAKAVRLKFTYVGPALVVLAVLCAPLVHPIKHDDASDYGFIAYATPTALDLVGILLLLLFCAGLMAPELSSGTIRMVLVRPIHRHEFFLGKLVLGVTYAVVLSLLVAVASWALAFAFGELQGVTYGGEMLYTGSQMVHAYVLGFLLHLCPQCTAVAYALMWSTLTSSTAAAIGTTVGLWIFLDAVKYPLGIAPYLFTSYLERPWQVFLDRCNGLPDSPWFPDALHCLITSGAWSVLFVAIPVYVLSRRNLNA